MLNNKTILIEKIKNMSERELKDLNIFIAGIEASKNISSNNKSA
ncbi:hypothetical protein [uncultured Clostridium sp.]|jgi:hypothetical protein|nr:hypothetical protein [uncultured Clostridium sp.]